MKKILFLSLLAVGCSSPDKAPAIVPAPIIVVIPCNCISHDEERDQVYNGLAQVTYDSGWVATGQENPFSTNCADDGKIILGEDVMLGSFEVVSHRKTVTCTHN